MKQKSLKKPTDRLLATVTVALTIVGLAMLSSASAVVSYERFGTNNYYFFRQLIFAAAGLALMYMVSRIDYHFWRRWSRPFLLLILVVLALVLVPSLGVAPGAARSWFQVGSFFVQPSEFAKLVLIFYLASWFERKKGAENNFWFGVLPPLLMAALWIAVKVAPYRSALILTFLDPTKDPLGIGYHISQALLAIGSGGIWGYGFGASRQKYNYLPEPIGDSIFAVMAEELGFLRVVAAVLLFGIFIWAGLRVARHAPDRFGQLAGIGITAWIGFQAFLNIAAISGILPLTGVTLPFISNGGSSLVVALLGAGVLLNISRQRL